MRRWLAWMSLILIMLISLSAVSRGRAEGNPRSNMFSELTLADGQRQGCWHGLCPGQITLAQARRALNSDPAFAPIDMTSLASPTRIVCWNARADHYKVCALGLASVLNGLTIYLNDEPGPGASKIAIQLGDLQQAWHTPAGMSEPFCGVSMVYFGNHATVQIHWFGGDSPFPAQRKSIGPLGTHAAIIEIRTRPDDSVDFASLPPWRGYFSFIGHVRCDDA